MNGDLISREALKEKLQARHDNSEEDFDKGYNIGIETAIYLIDNAPTVETYTKDDMTREYLKGYNACKDMNERPQGEWVEKQETPASVSYYCSNCKMSDLPVSPYCPWCGAKMKGGAEK